MKNILTSAIALAASTMVAHADGPTGGPAIRPVAAAPVEAKFAGFYGGLEYGRESSSGDSTAVTAVGPVVLPLGFDDNDAFGAFAGYNRQSGNLVYGGELRYLSFSDLTALNFEIDDVWDVRGRLGVTAGSFLFYGALGWSWANTSSPTADGDLDGLNYGLGVEYNVTERVMVALDYTIRDMEGDFNPNLAYDGDVETLSVRIGMRF